MKKTPYIHNDGKDTFAVVLPRVVAKAHGIDRRIRRFASLEDAIAHRDMKFVEFGISGLLPLDVQSNLVSSMGTNEGTISSSFERVKTIEELMSRAKLDPKIWEVERVVPNCWDVTNSSGQTFQNFQLKAWLKRKFHELDVEYLKELLHDMPTAKAKRCPKGGNHLLEVNIPDLHLGKLCWAPETGEDYDLKIARTRFLTAIDRLLSLSSSFDVERIIFPIGSDFLHVDTMQNTTTAGTAQDVEGRWAKLYTLGVDLLIEAVDRLREIAPVEAILVTGNHDTTSSYCAAHALAMYFRRIKNITVDWSPAMRKYRTYHDNLIGFAHGHGVKKAGWLGVMAAECPEWSNAKYRELHLGHHHHQVVEELTGLTIRHLGSLSGTDSWHNTHGYVQTRKSASAFVYTKNKGLTAELTCNI